MRAHGLVSQTQTMDMASSANKQNREGNKRTMQLRAASCLIRDQFEHGVRWTWGEYYIFDYRIPKNSFEKVGTGVVDKVNENRIKEFLGKGLSSLVNEGILK